MMSYLSPVPLGGLLAAQQRFSDLSQCHRGRPCNTEQHERPTCTLKAGTYRLPVRLERPGAIDTETHYSTHASLFVNSHILVDLVSKVSTPTDLSAGHCNYPALPSQNIWFGHAESTRVGMQKTSYFLKAGTHINAHIHTHRVHQSPSPNLLQKAALSSLYPVFHQINVEMMEFYQAASARTNSIVMPVPRAELQIWGWTFFCFYSFDWLDFSEMVNGLHCRGHSLGMELRFLKMKSWEV